MTRNYLLQDPILDYFKEMNKRKNAGNGLSFQSFIMEQGNKFESEIMKILYTKFNGEIKSFSRPISDDEYTNTHNQTIDAIKNKTPIIYQGVLIDNMRLIRGIPDLIVRKDYLTKLFSNFQCTDLKNDYYIVDIKFSTLHLCANGIDILNSGSVPAYKGQLFLYNRMLNEAMGYNGDTYSFILGKRYEYEAKNVKYSENSSFSKAGIINYDNGDKKYIEMANAAVSWLKDLKTHGKTWKLLPIPSRPELYPNMSNTQDYPWHEEKINLANSLAEISSLWYCGIKERKISHEKGILSWRDDRLSADIMGIKGNRVNIINKMITINRDDTTNNIVFPEKINNDYLKWQSRPDDCIELFIDFETINTDILSVKIERENYIFLIGVGWDNEKYQIEPIIRKRKSTNESWKCKQFLLQKLDNSSENEMINEFLIWINSIEQKYRKPVRLYHWSNAEKYQFEFAFTKHKLNGIGDIVNKLFDLKTIFVEEPILIKSCFGFSLKDIAKKLYNAGLIDTTWYEKSTCSDGMTAMILSKHVYDSEELDTSQTMKDIKGYNEIDCKVLFEILKFLRSRTSIVRRSARIQQINNDNKLIPSIINNNEVCDDDEETNTTSNNKICDDDEETTTNNKICDDEEETTDDEETTTTTTSNNKVYDDEEETTDDEETTTSNNKVCDNFSKVEIELATAADDETYENIQEFLEPVSISSILKSNTALKNKIRAIAIYNSILSIESHTHEYTTAINDIKLLIGMRNVFEYDHVIYDTNEANLSDAAKHVVDNMRKKAIEQKVTISDIINSKLHENKKIKALEMYDFRNRIGIMHEEFIPRDAIIRRYINNPKNYEEDVLIIDKINTMNIDIQTKNTMISWHMDLETHGSDSESGRVLESKLNTALKIPFNISHLPNYDNGFAQWIWEYKQKLDSKLYGMQRVKTQLIQCLVNQHTNPITSQQVIALAGAPGIGKTAICQAHAFASNIPITFCNVGAITDSTFFKGSNGVYIGAEPGNIVKSLISMGVDNGIIVLDEIDKIIMENHRSKGVYTSLLEIIDPSQNSTFNDEFLPKITINLNKIRFFCTMNDHTLIDPILLDRIKVIHIDPYEINDKINIARTYFINSIAKNYGFTDSIKISDEAIKFAIESTKNMGTSGKVEKGVRFLKQILEDSISWVNTVKTLYNGDDEKFQSLIGENYKNYPRKFDEGITLELIVAVTNNLSTKKEKIPHQHMYL
jgi:ATP-dependent Lon protease